MKKTLALLALAALVGLELWLWRQKKDQLQGLSDTQAALWESSLALQSHLHHHCGDLFQEKRQEHKLFGPEIPSSLGRLAPSLVQLEIKGPPEANSQTHLWGLLLLRYQSDQGPITHQLPLYLELNDWGLINDCRTFATARN